MATKSTETKPTSAEMQKLRYMSRALSYVFVGGYLYFIHKVIGGIVIESWSHAIGVFFALQALGDLLVATDQVFLLFPNTVVSDKKRKPSTSLALDIFYVVKTRIFLFALPVVLNYYGILSIAKLPSNLIDAAKFLFFCQVEAFLMGIVRDLTGMHFFHAWSHKNAKAYKYHKVHHVFGVDISAWRANYFDWPDLFLENGIGVILGIVAHWALFREAFPVYTFIFLIWHDGMVHSINPWVSCYLNPVLDSFLNPTISHNLHHALLNSHYYGFPFHQLKSKGLEKDIEQYDRIFETAIGTK
jgi:hypothetical protein